MYLNVALDDLNRAKLKLALLIFLAYVYNIRLNTKSPKFQWQLINVSCKSITLLFKS